MLSSAKIEQAQKKAMQAKDLLAAIPKMKPFFAMPFANLATKMPLHLWLHTEKHYKNEFRKIDKELKLQLTEYDCEESYLNAIYELLFHNKPELFLNFIRKYPTILDYLHSALPAITCLFEAFLHHQNALMATQEDYRAITARKVETILDYHQKTNPDVSSKLKDQLRLRINKVNQAANQRTDRKQYFAEVDKQVQAYLSVTQTLFTKRARAEAQQVDRSMTILSGDLEPDYKRQRTNS